SQRERGLEAAAAGTNACTPWRIARRHESGAVVPCSGRRSEDTMALRRRYVLGGLGPASLALAAACGGSPAADTGAKLPAQKQHVEWWAPATGALKPGIDALVAAANASNRQLDVQVTAESVGIADESRAKFT